MIVTLCKIISLLSDFKIDDFVENSQLENGKGERGKNYIGILKKVNDIMHSHQSSN